MIAAAVSQNGGLQNFTRMDGGRRKGTHGHDIETDHFVFGVE